MALWSTAIARKALCLADVVGRLLRGPAMRREMLGTMMEGCLGQKAGGQHSPTHRAHCHVRVLRCSWFEDQESPCFFPARLLHNVASSHHLTPRRKLIAPPPSLAQARAQVVPKYRHTRVSRSINRTHCLIPLRTPSALCPVSCGSLFCLPPTRSLPTLAHSSTPT
jgi:hypothetical protein